MHDGRYYGMDDWPPSPARLFQALVAGAGLSGPLADSEIEALKWLENCVPPVIACPRMVKGESYSNYVPNNDLDAKQGDPRLIVDIKTSKLIRPFIFDASVPFLYAWIFDKNKSDLVHARIIQKLADKLYQFGRGVDLAWAWSELLSKEEFDTQTLYYPGSVYRPFNGGGSLTLKSPCTGSIESLNKRYAANSKRFDTIISGHSLSQSYRKQPKAKFNSIAYNSPPSYQVYELRKSSEESKFAIWPLEQVTRLVVTLRDKAVQKLKKALIENQNEIESYFVGRKANGADASPTENRVRIIPLPSIGFHHADRGIRRIIIEVSSGCPICSKDVFWAFSGIQLKVEEAECMVDIVRSENKSMNEHYGIDQDKGYQVWRSVTPVALPDAVIDSDFVLDNVKNNSKRIKDEVQRAAAVIQALRYAHIRANANLIRVQREPFESNGQRVEPFAEGTRFSKQRLWHVEISFTEPIKGPLLIGDGRFLGLGLMAPKKRERYSIPKIAHYLCFKFNYHKPIPLKFTVPLAEKFRSAALKKFNGNSFALSGHSKPSNLKDDHQHAFFLPLPRNISQSNQIEELHLWCPYGFTQDELSALQRVKSLYWGKGEYPVKPVMVRMQNELPEDGLFAKIMKPARKWRSLTPYVPPRHFYRGNLHGAKLKVKDSPEQQLIDSLKRSGIHVPCEIHRLANLEGKTVSQENNLPQAMWDIVRVPVSDTSLFSGAVSVACHNNNSEFNKKKFEQRIGFFYELFFESPVVMPLALGHSSHFGLGLFVPVIESEF